MRQPRWFYTDSVVLLMKVATFIALFLIALFSSSLRVHWPMEGSGRPGSTGSSNGFRVTGWTDKKIRVRIEFLDKNGNFCQYFCRRNDCIWLNLQYSTMQMPVCGITAPTEDLHVSSSVKIFSSLITEGGWVCGSEVVVAFGFLVGLGAFGFFVGLGGLGFLVGFGGFGFFVGFGALCFFALASLSAAFLALASEREMEREKERERKILETG